MKKTYITLLATALFFFVSTEAFSQEDYGNSLNAFVTFGGNPTIGGHYEIQVIESLTVAPEFRYFFNSDGDGYTAIGARANYYFDTIFKLKEPWDVWFGANVGWYINYSDTFALSIHGGVEYKFNETIGLIAEFGGGRSFAGGLGVAFHL